MPAKCVSSVSPRFHYRRVAFCFLPLAAILEFSFWGFLFFLNLSKSNPLAFNDCFNYVKVISFLSFFFCPILFIKNTFFLIVYTFIHICIHSLGHLYPLPPHPPPFHLTLLTSRQNLFCPFSSILMERKHKR
jgi:hypothetical protein